MQAIRLRSGRVLRLDAKKHPRKIRQQVPPIRIEEQYAKALVKHLSKRWRAAYAGLLKEVPKLAAARHEQKHGRMDEFNPDEPRGEDGKWSGGGGAPTAPGLTRAGDENGSRDPKPGDAFVVFRLGADRAGPLDNKNAGNAKGVAVHLGRAQDTAGPAQPGGFGTRVHAYRVTVTSEAGDYVKYNAGKATEGVPGKVVGRYAGAGLVQYSFPKGGAWRATPIGSASADDLTAHLRKSSGGQFKSFADARGAGAEAIRDYFAKHVHARADSPESRRAQQLVAGAAADLRRSSNKPQIAGIARKFAEQTSTHQRIQLHAQLHDAIGIDPDKLRDPDMSDRIDDFVRENVGLITRIPDDLHDDVEALVSDAVRRGRPANDLAEDIEERFGVAERHARMIARDQIGKLNSDVNHTRQRALGIRRFVWRSVQDERVRGTPGGKYPNALPSHFDLDGQMFDYDDPPQPEGADEPLLPGQDYSCRCYAEGVYDDVLGPDDDDDTEPDDLDEDTDLDENQVDDDLDPDDPDLA